MRTPWEHLANEAILEIRPYQPGKPMEELERELGIPGAIKLASNENPLPPAPGVLKALRDHLDGLNRYPDGSGHYLRHALADRHGVDPDAIVLGNGSNELLTLLVRTFVRPGDEVVIPHPSFVVYPSLVQAAGGIRVVTALKDFRLDLPQMARAITPLTKMVLVANPNNPTGTIVTDDEVDEFLAHVPERTIVVFDEAYVDFAQGPGFPDTLAHLRGGRRVVVLRTFSKIASLAGLRVGYGVADPGCVALVNRLREPFNVNTLAQVAALAALEDSAHTRAAVLMIEEGVRRLSVAFDQLGLRYAPSRANFVCVEVGDAQRVYGELLKLGVIVRPLAAWGLEHAIRVTVGTPDETTRFLDAFRRVVVPGGGRA